MLRKKKKAPVEIQDPVLSDRLSFLDVIVETCKHSGRHTLIADAGDATYTVMIDSGGPFNADAGGLSGREVLVKPAPLRHGTYTNLQRCPAHHPPSPPALAPPHQRRPSDHGPAAAADREGDPVDVIVRDGAFRPPVHGGLCPGRGRPNPTGATGRTGPSGGYGGGGGGGSPRRPNRAPHRVINR